jgi:hypothetical protein
VKATAVDGFVLPAAEEALRESLRMMPEATLYGPGKFRRHHGWATAMAASEARDLVAIGSEGGPIRIWDVQRELPRLIRTLQGDDAAAWLAFDPGSRRLVSWQLDETLAVFDVEHDAVLLTLGVFAAGKDFPAESF